MEALSLFGEDLPLLPQESESLEGDYLLQLLQGPLASDLPGGDLCLMPSLNVGEELPLPQNLAPSTAPVRAPASSAGPTILLAPVRTTRGPPTKLRCIRAPAEPTPGLAFPLQGQGMMQLAPQTLAVETAAISHVPQPPPPASKPIASMMKKEDIVSPQQQVSGGSNTPGSSATRMDVEEPTEDGDESDDGGVTQNPRSSQAKPQGGSKRKAPDVDWRSITDPVERRRQRRLAKNRVTAARSRERKKVQWAELEARLQNLEAENGQLREVLARMASENTSLRAQLDQMLTAGASVPTSKRSPFAAGGQQQQAPGLRGSSTSEPAVLAAFIAIVLIAWCSSLPGSEPAAQPSLLPAAIPAMLLIQLLQDASSGTSALQTLQDPSSLTAVVAQQQQRVPSCRLSASLLLMQSLFFISQQLRRGASRLKKAMRSLLKQLRSWPPPAGMCGSCLGSAAMWYGRHLTIAMLN